MKKEEERAGNWRTEARLTLVRRSEMRPTERHAGSGRWRIRWRPVRLNLDRLAGCDHPPPARRKLPDAPDTAGPLPRSTAARQLPSSQQIHPRAIWCSPASAAPTRKNIVPAQTSRSSRMPVPVPTVVPPGGNKIRGSATAPRSRRTPIANAEQRRQSKEPVQHNSEEPTTSQCRTTGTAPARARCSLRHGCCPTASEISIAEARSASTLRAVDSA